MEYEAIGWRNGKCRGNIMPSLPAHFSVRHVSDSGSSLVSGSPYIVASFVNENKLAYSYR